VLFETVFSVLRNVGVVEGGTGEMKKKNEKSREDKNGKKFRIR
jgi:hypothetical protein